MISFHDCDDRAIIASFKADYLDSLTAPMDGMWDAGFTNPAPHWEIRIDGELAGYYAANDEGSLLQFYVVPSHFAQAPRVFKHVVEQDSITHAMVSTIDPSVLSLCLDWHKEIDVHTLLFEKNVSPRPSLMDRDDTMLRLVQEAELERIIDLQILCLGGDENLRGWLNGYTENLVNRQDIFILEKSDDWIGIGECRRSDAQKGVADLGMMVAPNHRGDGWATTILSLLSQHAAENDLVPVCSTTVENIGAQIAIKRAGFVSRHRILNVTF